jgi:hypothetical protein
VTEALVAPQTSYDKVPAALSCPGSYESPGQTSLEPFDPNKQWLTARADHAVNIGFAVWKPPGEPFVDPDTYEQI